MRHKLLTITGLLTTAALWFVLLSMPSGRLRAAMPGPPAFASSYRLVFGQDFTTLTSLSQLKVSSTSIGSGTWIAHTPTNRDFFTFEDPSANYRPFGVGSGYLDIRVQQDGNDPNNWFGGFSGGLLSSMDSQGAGFAQQYGYFECSMWTPGTPNSWPAFWLLSAPNLTNSNLPYLAEIDVMEASGNSGTGPNQNPPGNPNAFSVGWHSWGQNGNPTTTGGGFFNESGLATGYHTYGVDVEPTGISWYFDRQLVWQAPIFSAAEQPLLLLMDLALGSGNFNNSTNTGYNWALTPNPTDLKIQYIAVWASPNSPNYGGGVPAAPTGLSAMGGNGQVSLSWNASSGAGSYNVYRGTSPGSETLLATGIPTASYPDTTAANGTTYYYEVTAVNSSGISGKSNEVSAKASAGGSGGALPSPWLNQDVGTTYATGSSTYASGTFTLNGAGSGAYYVPDRFQFVYQTVSGDCSIVARVATQANSNPYAHAGVMIRDGLANNSGFVDMTLYPNGGGAIFQNRADSGNPNSVPGVGTAPYWVKITRSGNTFMGAVSANGTTWTSIGSTTLTMPSTVYIGLVQASGIDGVLATSTFDNVTVSGVSSGGSVPVAPTGLAATAGNGQITLNWNASSGAASYSVYRGTSSGGETVLATGITANSYTDAAAVNGTTYYYEVTAVNSAGISGNSNEVSAKTSGIGAPAAPTGLSATAGNGQIALSWNASSGATSYDVYRGTSSGGETVLATGITTASYTDATAVNGTTYYYDVTAVNSAGISGNSGEVSAKASAGNGGGGALPSPWLNQDVGITYATGSSTYAGGTFTLNGAGSGAYYAPDRFQFAYQAVSGDCSIVARVATQANSNPYALAGVMIRDGLADNSGFADMALYPSGGAFFQYRADGGNPNGLSGVGTAPYWVKITRSGNTFTGSVSANGATWITVGSTTLTMPSTVYIGLVQASGVGGVLATSTFDNVSVGGGSSGGGSSGVPGAPTGLSATAGNGQISLSWNASSGAASYDVYRGTSSGGETVLATGITTTSYTDTTAVNGTTYYYEVTAVNSSGISGNSNEVSAKASAGSSGGGALPSPWLNQDVGITYATGSSAYASGTFTLNGAGSGAYYVPDRFQFAYQAASGDCSVIARVATQANSNPYAHAGVLIRDGLADDSGFADVTLYPNGGGALFQYRADGGNPNSVSGVGTAPYWVKITRSGNTFTGSVSANGTTWTTIGSTTLTMPSTVYIGLVQASGVNGVLATSTFDNVTVAP